jgi:hypothetical protein
MVYLIRTKKHIAQAAANLGKSMEELFQKFKNLISNF